MDHLSIFILGLGLGFILCEVGNRRLFREMHGHAVRVMDLLEKVTTGEEYELTEHGRELADRLAGEAPDAR